MNIVFTVSSEWEKFPSGFKDEVKNVVSEAAEESSKLLPNLSKNVNIVICTGDWVIYETGGNGWSYNKDLLILTLDPDFKGDREIQQSYISATVYHELNHCSRYASKYTTNSFMESAIMEGLATVFERDYGKSKPQWGIYDAAECKKWVKEIRDLGKDINHGEYMYTHSDGRRWIGYKTGTYLVDQAVKNSGRDVIDLTTNASYKEIFNLATSNK